MASLFLSFSFLLGEFVFANILVGTRYETLQIYLYNMRQTSGHFTSALVMTYFLFIFFTDLVGKSFQPRSQTMSYVTAKNLTKRFGDNTVFEDIHFNIEQGEFITLLGPSGCGKSTLLRSLAGLNPVDGGEIWVNGEDITHQVPQERGIGMVFQSYALFPNMTVEGNIAFGLKMKKLANDDIRREVAKVIKLVDLAGKEKHYPHQLSGGQRQRVALARAWW